MTLGGLALAVGILVDEAPSRSRTSTRTCSARISPSRAACSTRAAKWSCRGCLRCSSVVAVFVPSFFMTGVSRSLFVPLSLAVGFAMIASFLLSSSLRAGAVRLAARQRRPRTQGTDRGATGSIALRDRLGGCLRRLAPLAWIVVGVYAVVVRRRSSRWSACVSAGDLSQRLARRQFQLRFRAPAGTQVRIDRATGDATCSTRSARRPARTTSLITLGYVGVQPSSLSDQHHLPVDRRVRMKACCNVALRTGGRTSTRRARRKLRDGFRRNFPDARSRSSPATSSTGS